MSLSSLVCTNEAPHLSCWMLKLVCLEFSNSFQFISHFLLSLLLPFSRSHSIVLSLPVFSSSSIPSCMCVPSHSSPSPATTCRGRTVQVSSALVVPLSLQPPPACCPLYCPFHSGSFLLHCFSEQSTKRFQIHGPSWPHLLLISGSSLCFRGKWLCPLLLPLHIRDAHVLLKTQPRAETRGAQAMGVQAHRVLHITEYKWCMCWEMQHHHRCRGEERLLQLWAAEGLEELFLGARKHQKSMLSLLSLCAP